MTLIGQLRDLQFNVILTNVLLLFTKASSGLIDQNKKLHSAYSFSHKVILMKMMDAQHSAPPTAAEKTDVTNETLISIHGCR